MRKEKKQSGILYKKQINFWIIWSFSLSTNPECVRSANHQLKIKFSFSRSCSPFLWRWAGFDWWAKIEKKNVLKNKIKYLLFSFWRERYLPHNIFLCSSSLFSRSLFGWFFDRRRRFYRLNCSAGFFRGLFFWGFGLGGRGLFAASCFLCRGFCLYRTYNCNSLFRTLIIKN